MNLVVYSLILFLFLTYNIVIIRSPARGNTVGNGGYPIVMSYPNKSFTNQNYNVQPPTYNQAVPVQQQQQQHQMLNVV